MTREGVEVDGEELAVSRGDRDGAVGVVGEDGSSSIADGTASRLSALVRGYERRCYAHRGLAELFRRSSIPSPSPSLPVLPPNLLFPCLLPLVPPAPVFPSSSILPTKSGLLNPILCVLLCFPMPGLRGAPYSPPAALLRCSWDGAFGKGFPMSPFRVGSVGLEVDATGVAAPETERLVVGRGRGGNAPKTADLGVGRAPPGSTEYVTSRSGATSA